MADAVRITEQSIPRFADEVVFRFDEARERWVILAPERVLMPDEIAVEILKRCDGASVAAIVDDLARTFQEDADVIRGDVVAMLQDLTDKGVLAA